MVFILITIFVVILTDHFEAVKNEPPSEVNGDDVCKYLSRMVNNMIPFRKVKRTNELVPNEYGKYLDRVETLAIRTDQMLKVIERLADEKLRELNTLEDIKSKQLIHESFF